MRVEELFAFIEERHKIYELKSDGVQKPWTDDPILRSYRFCNVYRQLDTETQWVYNNWGLPNEFDLDYWFACAVFRLTNWHETAEELGYPVPWNKAKFIRTLQRRKDGGEKVYSGAYTISTNGVAMEKHLYLAEQLSKLWKNRKLIRYIHGEPLREFHTRLKQYPCMGDFMAAQVVADMKQVGEAATAPDKLTFASPGPGSKRGLNRVCGRHPDTPWRADSWLFMLTELHARIKSRIKAAHMPFLDAQDLQNCLCEFDKYERVRLGEGRPRSKYNGDGYESI